MNRACRRIVAGLGIAAACIVLLPRRAGGVQGRPLTVEELKGIFASGGDVAGWDEFDVPEFVAAAYGARARSAVLQILQEPAGSGYSYYHLEAVTTAQYGKVGIPVSVLLRFAERVRDARGVIRQRALIALSMKPDPTLRGFWLEVAREKNPSFRQVAAAGLACALGSAARPDLESLALDSAASVAAVARFHIAEQDRAGLYAKDCGGKATRAAADSFPPTLRPPLRARGERILQRIP